MLMASLGQRDTKAASTFLGNGWKEGAKGERHACFGSGQGRPTTLPLLYFFFPHALSALHMPCRGSDVYIEHQSGDERYLLSPAVVVIIAGMNHPSDAPTGQLFSQGNPACGRGAKKGAGLFVGPSKCAVSEKKVTLSDAQKKGFVRSM